MQQEQKERRVVISDDAAWVQKGSRVVVMNLAELAADPVVLEGSAADIWSVLDAAVGTAVSSIVSELADAYEVTDDQIRADVEQLIETLITRGLVSSC